MTKYLADGLLASFSTPLIVVQGKQACGIHWDVPPDVATHSHEEADTLNPLHILESLRTNTMKQIDVHCGDTDVLLLLIDLFANIHHGFMTKVNFVRTGKKSKDAKDVIDIIERVQALDASKAIISLELIGG